MIEVLPGLEADIAHVGGSELLRDYLAGAPGVAPFYAGFPWSLEDYRALGERVRQQFSAGQLQAMAAAVRASSPAGQERLDRIANGDGFFVSTGQQAGLFGGPAYTVYKVLTAVRLAEQLEEALGVPVAPLFWVPGDDHDWDEVNHTLVLNAQNELVEVRLGGEDDHHSMARRGLGEGVQQALDVLEAALPPSDFTRDLLAVLRRSYQPDRSVASAFSELVAELFAPFGLLITESSDPALKRLSVPVFRRELEQADGHARLLRGQTDRLIAAGYAEQVPIADDAANVMYEDEQGRERLMRGEGGWQLRRTKRALTEEQVAALLESDPARFSANVLLRPVVASHVFPTLAYIGGPAEVAYFGQIGCLFAAHEVPMPLVVPRFGVDLVERKVKKVLDKFTLAPADLRRPFHELASQIARDELPSRVRETLVRLRADLTAHYAELTEGVQGIDPTLRGPLEGARNASHKQADDAEKKILSHLKKQNEIGLEQLRKAAVHLFPNGVRQERLLNFATYVARYGPELLPALARAMTMQLDGRAEGWNGVQCS